MQDRIIGPLTMIQFVYAVIGFGLCYAIVMSGVPAPLSYVLAAPIALFVICLDFVKINERPFMTFFAAALTFMFMPKQRFWHQGDDSTLDVEIYHVGSREVIQQHKDISHEEIETLAKKIDTGTNLIRN